MEASEASDVWGFWRPASSYIHTWKAWKRETLEALGEALDVWKRKALDVW
jgi:hypothetical protein